MAASAQAELRIYCICGQKMRVSESMFGLPGKCVACRQKIRVPTREEIPADAHEIYLKDHPEFLRKPQPRGPVPVQEARPPAEEPDDVTLGEASETVRVPVLDILEPLRVLCSLDHKIRRQLKAVDSEGAAGSSENRAALEGYQERVRNARAELDDQLRQRLMEVAIELSSTLEKIIQTGLSARIGEIEFRTYANTVDMLRRRRDSLERLQQNLRAWVMVNDPHMAGGYTNVSLDQVPSGGFQVILPPDADDPRSLFDQHMEMLREALVRRDRAELRLRETERLRAEGSMSPLVLADCRADCEAEKYRADAEVTFRQNRLDQLGNDCAADIQTIQACLERARKQSQEGAMDRARFAAAEREMTRAQRDCARVHSLVSKALLAGSARDIPHATGSLLKRMVRPEKAGRTQYTADLWVGWASALAMGLCVFLPLVDNLSPIQAYQKLGFQGQIVHWIMVLPVFAGALATIAASLPWRPVRGLTLLTLWFLITLIGALFVHESQYALSLVAARFRQGSPWWIRPGMVVLLAADTGVLVAAALALFPSKRLRWAVPGTAGALALVLIAIATDFGGYYRPQPDVNVAWKALQTVTESDAAADVYDTSVTVSNHGGRTLLVGSLRTTARNNFTYLLEREMDAGRWQDMALLSRNEVRSVAPGAQTVFRHNLKPGDYRVRLQSIAGDTALGSSFSLPVPAPPPAGEMPSPAAEAPNAAAEEPPAPADETAAEHPVSPPTVVGSGTDVELRGVITAERRGPRFSIRLYLADGQTKSLDLRIGDSLNESWTVSEFNPDRQAVTVTNGERILILARGQRIPLD